jgi:hypothetical protein
MPVTHTGGVHLGSHLAKRLTSPDDRAFGVAVELLVVGDHVAGNEPTERREHGLRKRDGSPDVTSLAEHVQRASVVHLAKSRHRARAYDERRMA